MIRPTDPNYLDRVQKLRTTVFFAAVAHLGVELVSNFLPIIYPILVTQRNFSFAQIGTITLVATLSITLPQPLLGLFLRRFPARTIVLVALAWCGIFYGIIGLTSSFRLLLIWLALGGLGSALFHPAGSVMATATNSTHRGSSMSLFSVGGNLGAALSPLLMAIIIQSIGLRGTIFTLPIALLATIILWLISHPSITQKKTISKVFRRLNKLVKSYPTRAKITASSHNPKITDGSANATKAAPIALAFIVLFSMTRHWYQASITTFLPLWIDLQGKGTIGSATVLFALVGSIPIGSLVGGTLSDRLGRWQVMLAAAVLMLPTHTVLLIPSMANNPVTILGPTSFLGFLIGMTYPVAIVMAHDSWPKNIGVASGLVMGVGGIPGGIGASILGIVADSIGLKQALSTLTIPLLIGILSIVFYRLARVRINDSK